ncbi:MAG TPA: FAD:protein FMN transferase [Planctomycetes bacterium]|nr:FAD:protein FMN transferase [Planctomycetota bacterium]
MNKINLFLVVAALTVSCSQKTQPTKGFEFDGFVMGTSWHATCVSNSDLNSTVISDALEEVDRLMSTYKPASEVSLFSKSKSGRKMSAPSFYVISVALDIAEKSAGAFDPTVMPLVNLWGFGPAAQQEGTPSNSAIEAAMQQCGWQHLNLSTDSFYVGKDIAELELDLSAIAKGFGADHAATALEMQGVQNYMIEVGGEIRAKGNSIKQRPWRLAIDSPNEENYSRVIELSSGAIATSGDYRNMRIVDGKLISHTINPRTGRPVTHNLASVSIVADNCTIADAVATTCMVLGATEGMQFVNSLDNIEAYFITRVNENEFTTSETAGFPKALNLD